MINGKIEELMQEAMYVSGSAVYLKYEQVKFLEHFAKLIIRECISVNTKTAKTMRDNDLDDNVPAHQYNFEIREHFGLPTWFGNENET